MELMTKSAATLLAAATCALALPQAAQAQEVAYYPNEASRQLGECIALSTSGQGRIVTVRWFSTALGQTPHVSDAVKVDPAAKDQPDREMAAVFTRIFTEDCRDEAAVLMRANDGPGIQAAGGRLGQIAMQHLLADPQVLAAMMSDLAYVDMAAFSSVME